MKKLVLSILALVIMILPIGIFADSKVELKDGLYEVPVFLKHAHKEQPSMGNNAFRTTARVKVEEGKVIYNLYAKPIKFNKLDGHVTSFYVYKDEAKGNATEVTKTKSDIDGFDIKFTFLRETACENKINISVKVDAMGEFNPKAVLKLDWDKAQIIIDDKEQVDNKLLVASKKVIGIMVNGKIIKTDSKPYINKGRTMVPVRFISEALGLKVKWQGKTKTVLIGENQTLVKLIINNDKIIKADGSEILIESPAVITNSRTMVPVRAIAELFGAKVDWDSKTRTVIINK